MSEKVVLDKDDRDLKDLIQRGREVQQEKGIAEARERFDAQAATEEWHRMREVRTPPWTYYVVIEYRAGLYHAHALRFPEIAASGETVEAAKAGLAEALQTYLVEQVRQGRPVPMWEEQRIETVTLCVEELVGAPAPE